MSRKDLLSDFQRLCERPGAFTQDGSFSAVCAYMDGFDAALEGAALAGFREWLLLPEMRYSNLCWWHSIRRRINSTDSLLDPPRHEDDAILLRTLRDALIAFADELDAEGLDGILAQYAAWRSSVPGRPRPLDET